jgi:hypothetical protein
LNHCSSSSSSSSTPFGLLPFDLAFFGDASAEGPLPERSFSLVGDGWDFEGEQLVHA